MNVILETITWTRTLKGDGFGLTNGQKIHMIEHLNIDTIPGEIVIKYNLCQLLKEKDLRFDLL